MEHDRRVVSANASRLLCAASDVPPGTARQVKLGDITLAVFNLDGDFYATDDTCTHGFASLSEGHIEDGIIECPWHRGAFDIRTGEPREHPCTTPLRTYQVTLRDGEVWAELGDNAITTG
jgi:nitrite reductase/ring-hydroxylating ferredoxin subunit